MRTFICHCELPNSYFESIFTHPLNLGCPSNFGTLSLVDLLCQVFSDLTMTADAQPFPSLLAIGGYLFSLFSLRNVLVLNSPLLTNRCHSGMNCWELSPEIVETAKEGLWVCEEEIVHPAVCICVCCLCGYVHVDLCVYISVWSVDMCVSLCTEGYVKGFFIL